MLIYTSEWQEGFLDFALPDSSVRIAPWNTTLVPHAEQQFFERKLDWPMLWNYLRELGARDVVRKARSRHAERLRNRRYVGVGFGTIVESNASFDGGDSVAFLSPNSGNPSERIVLPQELVVAVDHPEGSTRRWRIAQGGHSSDAIQSIAGWTPHSGVNPPITGSDILSLLDLHELRTDREIELDAPGPSLIQERKERLATKRGRLTVLGYGNYVKTMALPELGNRLGVATVHEMDPSQIGRLPRSDITWDTAWWLREDEDLDVVLVANFHHQHAPTTIRALELGARSIVLEKPICTTRESLETLVEDLRATDASVFVAFQRRYGPFNRWLRQDLSVGADTPISCFCLAYEAPLPPLHWYRWPSSRSHVIANGSHWIDHFLWLNNYSRPVRVTATSLSEGTSVLSLVLENEAQMALLLTDQGSDRLGVREHTEYRANGRTVVVEDSSRYWSESGRRNIRRRRVQRLTSHRAMYREIGEALQRGSRGDSIDSLYVSAKTVLDLEEALEMDDTRKWQ